ncbi:MAG: hypothetical protein KF906_03050 [Actinobacteria bacterium]|nr:hypothetical protein [Actinomycetota bacterium]MCB0907584.1 hypothetical protein [Nocardioidaceae bacterium]
MKFAQFMATPAGRGIRVVAGLVLIALGINMGGAGLILAALGVVALVAGAANVCLISPLIGAPFRGGDAADGT